MRGMRLLIRPCDETDRDAIRRFYEIERLDTPDDPRAGSGFIAKMLGDVVAHVRTRLGDRGTLRIVDAIVASRLRQKGIGRSVIREIEATAREQGLERVTADLRPATAPFFRALGYEEEEGELVRNVVDAG